ncbi:nuclear exosome regulator NRDE2 [Rhynchophorus ferrugineus]|uniref:Protein NRDE2-like protein n=1 Tax=Rhynchophorus ferrugineus TaxID=354439 RepID=A0A834IQ69_RHYFE|nr:hypothetical protein GWI33_003671 [Rhynchophorus ferrugineus]
MENSNKMDIETIPGSYSWLNNSSFPEELVIKTGDLANESSEVLMRQYEVENNDSSDDCVISDDNNVNHDNDSNQSASYDIVLKGHKEYLSVNRIHRPKCPKYSVKYRSSIVQKQRHKRYFKINIKSNREVDRVHLINEENFLKRRTLYNKELNENPHNVLMWLDYLKLEDEMYEFEKNKKGSIAKSQRVLLDRKISIIEKALAHNLYSDSLYRELLKVIETYPSDEVQEKLERMIKDRKDNIILWQGLIENSQCSMTSAPQVLAKYTECLSILHQVRITATFDKDIFEQNILRILYQCGLFLRQTGLFERLWFLLNYYLDLTFGSNVQSAVVQIDDIFNEDLLQSLEESTLISKMPKHELWFRIEKLREACHWLPYVEDDCVDPQRMVFNEDVDSLLHPIAMPKNIYNLVIHVFTLLKVPLIPSRHATMQELGLDYVSWSLDSIESLLPIYLELYPIESSNHNILEDMMGFTAGPQYLKAIPGQMEYLKFVLSVMESCADRLQGNDQISVRIWWFRFQRLLIVLKRNGLFRGDFSEKTLRASVKNLLKKNQHNELYYVEYALIEMELGKMTQCQNILQTVLSRNNNKGIITENWPQSQTNQCYLYKVLVESIIKREQFPLSHTTKDTVLQYLLRLVLQRPVDTVLTGLLMEANTKFNLISAALLQGNINTLSPAEHFLPDFVTDWIICHAWFMYIHNGVFDCGSFLNKAINELKDKPNNLTYQIELIYECYCTILFIHDSGSSTRGSLLSDVLLKGLQEYPNNIHLLSLLANEQIARRCAVPKWWTIQKTLLESERPIAIIFCILILDKVQNIIIDNSTDTITGQPVRTSNYNNRLMNLFKKVTEPNVNTRKCGLIWRLYLNKATSKRDIFYKAMKECPWIKALHMDAVIHMPNELGLVQDLIIEKQLRIHVTPEELESLISD